MKEPYDFEAAKQRADRIMHKVNILMRENSMLSVNAAEQIASREVWFEDHPEMRNASKVSVTNGKVKILETFDPGPSQSIRVTATAAEYLRSAAALEGKPITLVVNEALLSLNEKKQLQKKKMIPGAFEITKGSVDSFDDADSDTWSDATKALFAALKELAEYAKTTAVEVVSHKKQVSAKTLKAALQARCNRLIGIADKDDEDIAYALKHFVED